MFLALLRIILIEFNFFLVNRIHRDKERIVEGQLRCESLKKHLERTNSPQQVFLSEDASGIVSKIVYDSRNNQLIGLVLPLNEKGIPILHPIEPNSAEKIKELMKLPQSNLVYIVVAQPLKSNAPPFILQIFGTNNKFKTNDVLNRWRTTEIQLKE